MSNKYSEIFDINKQIEELRRQRCFLELRIGTANFGLLGCIGNSSTAIDEMRNELRDDIDRYASELEEVNSKIAEKVSILDAIIQEARGPSLPKKVDDIQEKQISIEIEEVLMDSDLVKSCYCLDNVFISSEGLRYRLMVAVFHEEHSVPYHEAHSEIVESFSTKWSLPNWTEISYINQHWLANNQKGIPTGWYWFTSKESVKGVDKQTQAIFNFMNSSLNGQIAVCGKDEFYRYIAVRRIYLQ